MKWGVRRYRNYDGTLTAAGKKAQSKNRQARKNTRAQQKKRNLNKVKSMSTSELNEYVNKLALENKALTLMDVQQSYTHSDAYSYGKRFVNNVIDNPGKYLGTANQAVNMASKARKKK
jgi:hypothetical protein